MDGVVSLKWGLQPNMMVAHLAKLYESKQLCDVAITVEGKQLYAHKVVLAACSQYFLDIFSAHAAEKVVYMKFERIKSHHIEKILEFIYHGTVDVEEHDLYNFVCVADFLKIEGIYPLNMESLGVPYFHPDYVESNIEQDSDLQNDIERQASDLQNDIERQTMEKLVKEAMKDQLRPTLQNLKESSLSRYRRKYRKKMGKACYQCASCNFETRSRMSITIHCVKKCLKKPLWQRGIFSKSDYRSILLKPKGRKKSLPDKSIKENFDGKKESSYKWKNPTICSLCDKVMDNSKMIVHMRIHSGERPYKCKHCDYAGIMSCNLAVHMKSRHSLLHSQSSQIVNNQVLCL